MEIDVAEWREIEHPLGNNAAIANDDDGGGLQRGELGAEFVVGLDAVRLRDRQVQSQRRLFDRRGNEFEAASLGTIWLSYDEMNAEPSFDELLECGDGEARRAAENER